MQSKLLPSFAAAFTRSAVATKKGIDNSIPPQLVENAALFFDQIYSPLIIKFFDRVILSSGYRCPALNKLIGGSSTSAHTFAQAGDFEAIGQYNNYDVFAWAAKYLEFDQLIWEFGDSINPDWVHISFRASGNRREILRSSKSGKRTIYTPYKF